MITGVPAQIVVAFRLGTIELGIWFTVTAEVETVNVPKPAQPVTEAVSVYVPASKVDIVAAVILAVVIDVGLVISIVRGPVHW